MKINGLKIFVISFLFFLLSISSILSVDAKKNLDEAQTKFKIAQMLILGFEGTVLEPTNPIYDDIVRRNIGGVILFEKNASSAKKGKTKNILTPEQTKILINDLKSISRVPLFVALDQEGGKINRLPSFKGFDFDVPTNFELGEKSDLKYTYEISAKTAKGLKELGFNLNFAPCVDLNINPKSPAIGAFERSYSANPKIVYKNAKQNILAHKKYGIYTTLKHYPGHGSAKSDSHKDMPDVTNTWDYAELLPYKWLIKDNLADFIMVAHVMNKNFDEKYPASMSDKIASKILRKALKFKGLIVTDDIQMGALGENYTLEETLVGVINAGANVIIIGNNLSYEPEDTQKVIDIIYDAVASGKISNDKIENSYKKIIKYKKKMPR